jgi:inorganic pyrophosphatase
MNPLLNSSSTETSTSPSTNSIEMLIEIPYGSNVKYEIKNGKIICDRVLHTPMSYPFSYGYLTNTLADDQDEMDAVLLTNTVFVPNTHIQVRIIGALMTKDEKGLDAKIIVLPIQQVDPRHNSINNIDDISIDILEQIKFFFKYYKILEKNKWVEVNDFCNKEAAEKLYLSSLKK